MDTKGSADQISKEGGFETRPYDSQLFFAPFAVNTPNPNLYSVISARS